VLEVIELDKLFWQPGTLPTPLKQWADIQQELVERPTWIMDGDLGPYDVIALRLRSADTVIVLDTSRWRCTWRALRRSRERADFWKWLWTWRRRHWPQLQTAIAIEAPQANVVVVHGHRAIQRLVDTAADTA
jgi:adenylate kinase family enzyme